MKIIDFERKGNVIRFYLGEKTVDWGWTNPDYKDFNGNTPDWLKPSLPKFCSKRLLKNILYNVSVNMFLASTST